MPKEPEWTSENMNRKKGDTTFEICGWCKHASCGTVRYGCYISTTCSLTKAYGLGHDVLWDTPCIIKNFGKADFESIVKSKRREIKDSQKQIDRLDEQITEIKKLSQKAEASPPLPDNKRYDYYDEGDVLYIFHEGKWNKGVCVSGYRHHDGCVSYVLEGYPKSKGGWGCGYAVPCVLKEWEYDYFAKNKSAFRKWLDAADKEYNGEKLGLDAYYNALANV